MDATTGQNGLQQARLFTAVGRGDRHCAHETGWDGQGRHRGGDCAGAESAGALCGRGRADERSAGVFRRAILWIRCWGNRYDWTTIERARHVYWMRRALELARRGIGVSSPNPAVGCVILDRAGQVVGEGWHEYDLLDHAEVVALNEAKQHALTIQKEDRLRGGTAYVTLEPCNHTGRTGPCTEALIAAGLGRVVAATIDPNPDVAGHGHGAPARGGHSRPIVGVCERRGAAAERGVCALEPAQAAAGADEGGDDAGWAHCAAGGPAFGARALLDYQRSRSGRRAAAALASRCGHDRRGHGAGRRPHADRSQRAAAAPDITSSST